MIRGMPRIIWEHVRFFGAILFSEGKVLLSETQAPGHRISSPELSRDPNPAFLGRARNSVVLAAIAGLVFMLFSRIHFAGANNSPENPDWRLTPGAIATRNLAQICTRGYASSVRPRGAVWVHLKAAMYQRYGIASGQHYGHVADHLIPLEIGGAPDDQRNLWPQPYDESHQKDEIENELHVLICDRRMPIDAAQARIARDWKTAVPSNLQFTPEEQQELAHMRQNNDPN
jgi:hypothetical protein